MNQCDSQLSLAVGISRALAHPLIHDHENTSLVFSLDPLIPLPVSSFALDQCRQFSISSPSLSLEILHYRPTILPCPSLLLEPSSTGHLTPLLTSSSPSTHNRFLPWPSLSRLFFSSFATQKYDQPLASLRSVSGKWIPPYRHDRLPACKPALALPYRCGALAHAFPLLKSRKENQ